MVGGTYILWVGPSLVLSLRHSLAYRYSRRRRNRRGMGVMTHDLPEFYTPKKQEEGIGQPGIRITKNLLQVQSEWELIVVTESLYNLQS